LANINKNILTRDMQHYAHVLAAKGDIVFSGFYNTDIADIESVASGLGLKLVATLSDNNWAVTHFKKE
jgi:ribosomal protein L11 methyltransferase